jgi:hypothetical protein
MPVRRRLLPLWAAGLVVAGPACAPDSPAPSTPLDQAGGTVLATTVPAVARDVPLDLETARRALAEATDYEGRPIDPYFTRDLETGEVEPEDRGWTAMGRWRVNLQTRRWVMTHANEYILLEYSGEFRFAQGRWTAQTTNFLHAH